MDTGPESYFYNITTSIPYSFIMPERKKDFPCLKCDIHVKRNDCAVQCYLCDLWIHQKCAEISDVLFKELVYQADNSGGTHWACKACRSSSAKLNKKINEIYKKVETLEEEQKDTKKEVETIKDDVKTVNSRIDKIDTTCKNAAESAQEAMFRELKDREEKKNNLIIHNLPEPGPECTKGLDRKYADQKTLAELLSAIDCSLNLEQDLKFMRRIGEKKEEPRPLVVGFHTTSAKSNVLKNAPAIHDTDFFEVSIAPDLTLRQRKEDEEVYKQCEAKNEARTGEDLNFIWKVVGPRGLKRLIKTKADQSGGRGQPLRRGRGSHRLQSKRNLDQNRTSTRYRQRMMSESEKRSREEEETSETTEMDETEEPASQRSRRN